MCGRFSIAVRIGIFTDRFRIVSPVDFVLPLYNISPSENVPVIIKEGQENTASMMRWGLIPSWVSEENQCPNLINARAEGLADKRMYRDLLGRGRCIVPATGFYEWRAGGKQNTPFYISRKDKSLFAMAGLFDTWKDPSGNEIQSFTIITTSPNDLVAPLHTRMPVILSAEGEKVWSGIGEDGINSISYLLVPYPSDEMEAFEVSRSVNNPANKSEAAVKRVQQGTLTGV